MERLRDAPDEVLSKDPALARAAALLRAEEPLAPSEIRQRKVAAALRARSERRRRGMMLSPAIAVMLIVLLGVASARLRRVVRELFGAAPAPPARVVPLETTPDVRPEVAQVAPPAPPVERVSPAPIAPPAAPVAKPSPTGNRPRIERIARPAPAAPAVTAPAPKPPEPAPLPSMPGLDRASVDEVTLVYDAFNALSNAHDHHKASRLLDEYLTRFPNGAIHEDALRLAIEAAMRSRSPRAATLGATYLARYPSGRFVEMATRARDGGTR